MSEWRVRPAGVSRKANPPPSATLKTRALWVIALSRAIRWIASEKQSERTRSKPCAIVTNEHLVGQARGF